jgi:hypothetical protein
MPAAQDIARRIPVVFPAHPRTRAATLSALTLKPLNH